jgi:glycine dehydrogenase subunit 1
VLNDTFFNEFTVRLPVAAGPLVEKLAADGILAGVPVSRLLPKAGLDDLLIVAVTETSTADDRAALVAAVSAGL